MNSNNTTEPLLHLVLVCCHRDASADERVEIPVLWGFEQS